MSNMRRALCKKS